MTKGELVPSHALPLMERDPGQVIRWSVSACSIPEAQI